MNLKPALTSLRRPGLWVPVAAIAALGSWPYITADTLTRETVYLILMFVTLASSLNILLGFAGYVNFGNVVFFGLGGYIGFYLIARLGWHLVPAALVAAAGVTLFALAIGGAVLRLRGAYFALVTIGINEAVRSLITNLDVFGASTGMSMHFSRYAAYGTAEDALWFDYGLLFLVSIFVVVISFLIKSSKTGLALQAIREDEDAAEELGINAPRMKILAFCASAFFPAIVGTLFYFKNANIEPSQAFDLRTSIETIVMVMLGGAGTVSGPVLGGALYERLRSTLITAPGVLRELQLFFAGLILLLIVLFVARGVIGWLRQRYVRIRVLLE